MLGTATVLLTLVIEDPVPTAAKFFDPTIIGTGEQAVDFIANILAASTEYSIIGKDLGGKILLWNEGAHRLYGYEPEEVIGKANAAILHTPESVAAERPQQILDAALRDGHWEGHIARRRKDDSQFITRASVTLRRDDAGQPIGFLLMSTEVARDQALVDDLRNASLFDSAIVGTAELARAVSLLRVQRIALDNAAAILITDSEGVILWVNPAFTTTTGYTAEESIGRTPRILKSGQHNESFYRGFWKAIRSGRMWRGEFINRRKDGTIYFDEQTVTPVRDAEGAVTHFIAVKHDITERKRGEEKLREANAQMNELLEHSPAVFYALKVDGDSIVPTLASQNVTRLLGFQVAETLNMEWWRGHLHPEDLARAEAGILETLTEGVSCTEYRMRHKDGTYRWIEDNRRLVRDAGGAPAELVGVWTDVTKRKQAQDELQKSERRFREMLDNLGLVSVMVDLDARVTYCNDCFLQLTGWRREEVIGGDWFERFVPSEQISDLRRTYSSLLANTADVRNRTGEILTRSGERRLIHWNNSVLRSASGEVIGAASIGEDITSRTVVERELRRSEEQLQFFHRASNDATWERNVETGEVSWSDRAFSMLGYTRETFHPTFEAFRAIVHPEDESLFQAALEEDREPGQPYQVRVRLRHADGSYVPILARGQLQRDTGRMLGVFTDLSTVERFEEHIREQAALLDQAHDAIIVRDIDHKITFWSKGAERLYGWPANGAMGRRFDDLLHIDAQTFEAAVKATLAGGVWTGEVLKTTADGTIVVVDCSWTLLRDDLGRPKSIIGIDTNITGTKKTELQLHESEQRYRLLFDRNPHPTWVYDSETLSFLAVNEAAVRLYGYAREEFLNMSVRDIRPPEHVGRLFDVLEQHSKEPRPSLYEVFKHRKKDGALIDVEIASSDITFAGRHATLVLANDVTERRRTEQQMLRAQRMESLGTLAGGIAHDLNNLLMPILMGVTLLRRMEPDERSLKAIDNIELSVKRGSELVKRVLLFTRGAESPLTAVELESVVDEVKAIVESTFPKNITFVTAMPGTMSRVIGDPTQLNQVLLNLCVNARDAMPNGGQITVSAANMEVDHQYAAMHRGATAGRYVRLEVSDNGSGMPQQVVDRIFDPFFTTKEIGKGTGLGLSTVQGIVSSFGGFVEVSSDVGKGSSFRVYLPADSGDAGATGIETEPERLPRGNGEVILVVDDEASILSITKQTLEEFGYAVLTAEDGAQAIGIYARERASIALVLTDMMMPVIDGAALIRALHEIDPDLRVIAVSGQGEADTWARAIKAGATHFLAKPYSAGVMLRTLFDALPGSSV